MKTVVYFATGAPGEVCAELKRLLAADSGELLRVVAPRNEATQLERLASLDREQILAYAPFSAALLWLQLWILLIRSHESEIVCFQSSGRFRSLKLIAWSLPGKLVFSDGEGTRLSCSRFQLLKAAVAPKGAICVIASASRERLEEIVASVRERYPGAPLHGVAYSSRDLFDSFEHARPWLLAYFRLLRRCAGRERFRAVVLPCTNENYPALKSLVWLLPVRRVEIYNENLDVFSGRDVRCVVRHCLWRIRVIRDLRRRSLAVGVIGSASAFFLKTILEDVRARFPGAPIHGLLPRRLEEPARGLFDATTIVTPHPAGAVRQAWQVLRRPYQCWVIPCTDEPYPRMKLLAFLLPFRRRQIYNEQADAFAARDLRTLCRHIGWRLREHLSFQILAGTAGRNPSARLLHLVVYALRLLAGAALLCQVRILSYVRARVARRTQPTVDLIYLDSAGPQAPLPAGNAGKMRLAARMANEGRTHDLIERINSAVRDSRADFICLFDSRCSMLDEDWLDRLLETFDECTGQVGPQVVSSVDRSVIRGGLAGAGGRPHWNSDHAVCCHTRPDWLAIDALPWVCIVLRRNAFLEAGSFHEAHDGGPIRVDLDFCRRLAAHGWHSICNQSVTASFPAVAGAGEVARAFGASQFPGKQ